MPMIVPHKPKYVAEADRINDGLYNMTEELRQRLDQAIIDATNNSTNLRCLHDQIVEYCYLATQCIPDAIPPWSHSVEGLRQAGRRVDRAMAQRIVTQTRSGFGGLCKSDFALASLAYIDCVVVALERDSENARILRQLLEEYCGEGTCRDLELIAYDYEDIRSGTMAIPHRLYIERVQRLAAAPGPVDRHLIEAIDQEVYS